MNVIVEKNNRKKTFFSVWCEDCHYGFNFKRSGIVEDFNLIETTTDWELKIITFSSFYSLQIPIEFMRIWFLSSWERECASWPKNVSRYKKLQKKKSFDNKKRVKSISLCLNYYSLYSIVDAKFFCLHAFQFIKILWFVMENFSIFQSSLSFCNFVMLCSFCS